MEQEEKKLPRKISFKIILTAVAVLLILCGAAGTYYFYNQNQKALQLLKDPTAAQKEEVKTILAKLSILIELPQDEEPQVATVLDYSKLKDQTFFAKAQNGDKVLIYTKAGKAILYRPSTNKIIEVGPISLGQNQEAPIKVAVYNGTNIAGLSNTFATNIVKTASNVNVVTRANAANKYERTIVVDLTNKEGLAKQMADLIGGTVSTLPEGEVKPADATIDLLIILGTNYTGLSAPAPASPSIAPTATPTQ
ncbi:MAG: LytR C-terminal domain-containing protein [Candidatus Woesebacteria bacterium]|nr:MAG: LytR C-terminal domain-containing protein [Candidatus Woesebacteria bacterium]